MMLGDIANIEMGISPAGQSVNRECRGLPLLNGPTEFGGHHPDPVQYTESASKLAQPGDLLFCVRGSTTGRMNWSDQKYAIGRGIAAISHKTDTSINPFIRGVVEYALSSLLKGATGSTFPNVSRKDLISIDVPVREVSEQRRIAHILGTLDDKIELNRQMNRTLDEIARTLFRSWFVDFDPVRAKMEGCQPDGMDAATAELFPDRLVDSELGPIPEGWDVKALGGFSDVRWGDTKVTKKSYVVDGGFQAYSASGPDGQLPCADYSEDGIVLSAIGANCGKTWLARDSWSCIKNTIRILQIPGETSIYYLYFVTGNKELWPKRGSAQPFISQGDARALRLLVPPREVDSAFVGTVLPLLDLINTNNKESGLLAKLRDSLLSRLIEM